MTNFLHWRKMTWALLAWGGGMTAWMLFGNIAQHASSSCGSRA